jgi:hypothetical protein
MPGPFMIGSKYKCSLDGLVIASGSVTINDEGSTSDVKITTEGAMGGPVEGKSTIDINTPVFSASPLDVLHVQQKLAATAGLFVLVDLVNGTTKSAWVLTGKKTTKFDPEKAGEVDWTLNVLGEIIEA